MLRVLSGIPLNSPKCWIFGGLKYISRNTGRFWTYSRYSFRGFEALKDANTFHGLFAFCFWIDYSHRRHRSHRFSMIWFPNGQLLFEIYSNNITYSTAVTLLHLGFIGNTRLENLKRYKAQMHFVVTHFLILDG